MNHRKIKKQAKRFLAGLPTRGIAFHYEERYPRNDGSVLIIERVPNSLRFHQAVNKLTGPVSHWDSPFIVEIVQL